MVRPNIGIDFNSYGIGEVLDHYKLSVPANQRPYAWEDEHIKTLLEDFLTARSESNQTYFLGTIVLTRSEGGRLEVADGQQRLTTASILIASIRDYLYSKGVSEKRAANKYTEDYLLEYDEVSGEQTQKLKLNVRNNDYFYNAILHLPDDGKREVVACLYGSHKRLCRAKEITDEFIEKIITPYGERERPNILYQWKEFLVSWAIVIAIEVPDHLNAYKMFETLNDRGLRASQTDILKNFFLGAADTGLDEVQSKWGSMVSVIEGVGDDDLVLKHIRHAWIAKHGPTVERMLASKVK